MFPSELTASKSAPLQREDQGEGQERAEGWSDCLHCPASHPHPAVHPNTHNPTTVQPSKDCISRISGVLGGKGPQSQESCATFPSFLLC